jgi:DNA polymerase I
MTQPKKLFLLDAMALIYRAYFAFSKNPRINSKGFNTSAIFGFANTLLDVLKNEEPTHIGVAFDTIAPTLRRDEFANYKANRQAIPEDLALSIPLVQKLLEGFRIPILFADGYEADDVIGTLAKQAEKEGFMTYMMTPDKDFGQLVTDKIFIYKPARMGNKAEILGVKEVCEKFEIDHPMKVIDILGLWGDASDNIPGIPGIGEKRAKELIAEFGSMEAIFENSDKLKGKIKENIEAFKAQGIQSKSLATIYLDAPVAFDPEKLKINDPDTGMLKVLFDELEFKTLSLRVFSGLPSGKEHDQPQLFDKDVSEGIDEIKTINNTAHNYHLVDTKSKRIALTEVLKKSSSFCFDTETTGIDPHQSELVGLSFSVKPGEAWFVNLPENYNDCHAIVQEFKEVFEDEKIEKTGQNLKYDISILKWYDVEVKGRLFDTMLAHYIIQPDMRHNMDLLAETYLKYRPVSIESLIGKKGKTQKSIRTTDLEILKDYACEDADITLQLRHVFEPELIRANAVDLFGDIEVPLVPVLASMEAEGVRLDIPTLRDYSRTT